MLDMVLGDPGIGLVTGADGTGDRPGTEREEREDAFSRAEVLDKVESHAKEYTAKKCSGRSGNECIAGRICRDVQDCTRACRYKQDTGN